MVCSSKLNSAETPAGVFRRPWKLTHYVCSRYLKQKTSTTSTRTRGIAVSEGSCGVARFARARSQSSAASRTIGRWFFGRAGGRNCRSSWKKPGASAPKRERVRRRKEGEQGENETRGRRGREERRTRRRTRALTQGREAERTDV